MYAWRGGRNKHVHGHVSSSKQLASWTEASSSEGGKAALKTNDAVIYLPLRRRELETQKYTRERDKKKSKMLNFTMFPACKAIYLPLILLSGINQGQPRG